MSIFKGRIKRFFLSLNFGRSIALAMSSALIFCTALCLADFDAGCTELRQGVVRLHVLANSDSPLDQAIKLRVRDEVLRLSSNIFASAESREEALAIAKAKKDEIALAADRALNGLGVKQGVRVEIGQSFFETREYDGFTLPAGEYDSVRILLGEGAGKNWWCVMFPTLCLPAACSEPEAVPEGDGDRAADIAKNAPRYEVRFKIIEWLEELKNYLWG